MSTDLSGNTNEGDYEPVYLDKKLTKHEKYDKEEISKIYDGSSTGEEPYTLIDNLLVIIKHNKKMLNILSEKARKYKTEVRLTDHDDDDKIFYKSIIAGSYNYFNGALIIREKKLIYDLNEIIRNISDNSMMFIDFDEECVKLIKQLFIETENSIKEKKKEYAQPLWIKNNKLLEFTLSKKELMRILIYHIDINYHINDSLQRELAFYTCS